MRSDCARRASTVQRCFPEPPSFPLVHQSLPLVSLAVPGAGQLLAGKKRGLAYLAAEVVLLGWHLNSAAIGRRERDNYRNLAFDVARAAFMPTVRDTAFEYFEHMADFVTSGPLDVDPGPDLVPPTDQTSYNGSVWGLASETFFRGSGKSTADDQHRV